MELDQNKSISIGINEDDQDDKNLYIVVNNSKRNDAFSILKAGEYYYTNTKSLFDTLKIDYTNNSITFEISEEFIENLKMFTFKIKEKERIAK